MESSDVVPGHIAARQPANITWIRSMSTSPATPWSRSPESPDREISLAFGTIYFAISASATRVGLALRAQAHRSGIRSARPAHQRLIGRALRQQHAGSTCLSVGTVSRISNVLRMLFSRSGTYPEGCRPADLAGTFPRDAAPLDSDSFSPNTAVGACRVCSGMGRLLLVDQNKLVGDPQEIDDGAIVAWPGAFGGKNQSAHPRVLGVDINGAV